MKSCSGTLNSEPETRDDMIWEYDGPHTAYRGECEAILLEMQKIFYADLESEEIGKGKVWLSVCHGYNSFVFIEVVFR